MNDQTPSRMWSSPTGIVPFIFVLISAVLLAHGRRDYPQLHVILDTGTCLLSGTLALFYWDLSARANRVLPRWLSISFAMASGLEFVHVISVVEWFGVLAPIANTASLLRPATWLPSAYILPIGIASTLWLLQRRAQGVSAFALWLIFVSAVLLTLFYFVPRYTAPGFLGITRLPLLPVPVLWAVVGWFCWRMRAVGRSMRMLSSMAALLCVANVFMLYSRAPHDTLAIIAHLGKIAAYLVMLLWTMRIAAQDVVQLIRAEKALASLNEQLESRVVERTAELLHSQQRLASQVERLNLLDRITRAIGERQDLRDIFESVLTRLETQLPVDFGCLCLYDPLRRLLTVTSIGPRSRLLADELAMPEQTLIEVDENDLSRCVAGQLVHEPDITQPRFPFPRRMASGGLRSLVIAPLHAETSVFGVLIAARRQADAFTSQDCEFLRQLSEHIALAADQARVYTSLQNAYDDLRRTQQAVMQQERLRVLGQMASGIAHDINNALSPVTIYTESLLEQEAGLSERGRRYLTTIQRAVEDVSDTVARIREFYRPREAQAELSALDLNQLVTQVIELTRARWCGQPQQRGIVIELRTELSDELEPTLGAEHEIRDALTNLVFNAVDAMPDGGTLTLRTLLLTTQDESGRALRRNALEVTDTGMGMDEDTRRRCLEPFFTTKGERGTGLGLAMVYGMIQRHSGDLQIDSALGKGTTIRLILPAAEPIDDALSHTATQPRIPAHKLRILLVDDDPIVLESLRELLTLDGHIVTTATGGQAGLDAFGQAQRNSKPFSVVITDLGMPHMDGRRVAASVRALCTNTPIILLTGWGQRLQSANDAPREVDRVLSKPPKLQELRAVLAELTERAAS